MGWVIIFLLFLVISIGLVVTGLILIVLNIEYGSELLKLAGLSLYLSIISAVMSLTGLYIWHKISIILVFTTIVLFLVSIVYWLLKNKNAFNRLKLAGISLLISILFLTIGNFFETDNEQAGESNVSVDEKSSGKEKIDMKEKEVAAKKKEEEEIVLAEAKKEEEEKAAAEAKKKEEEKALAEAKKKEEEKALAEAKKEEEEKALAEAKKEEEEKALAEAKKEEEEKALAEAKKKEEEELKALAKDFDYDMERFDELMNQNQSNMAPIVASLLNEQSGEDVSFTKLLASLEETITYIKNMQDYSNLEKYKKTNDHFLEGSAHLIGAYVFFDNFYKSNYDNSELFYTGFESYNKAMDEFKLAGKAYAKEYN